MLALITAAGRSLNCSSKVCSRKFKLLLSQRKNITIETLESSSNQKPGQLKYRLSFLVKPTIFVASFAASSNWLLSYHKKKNPELYTDHSRQKISKDTLFKGIVLANVSVFAISQLAKRNNWVRFRQFERQYLICSVYSKTAVSSMFGSVFNHIDFQHICLNMLALTVIEAAMPIDAYTMAHVYTNGGLFGCLGSYISNVLRPKRWPMARGASAAILSLYAYTVAEYPEVKLSVPLLKEVIPLEVPTKYIVWPCAILDAYKVMGSSQKVENSAHLAGVCYGYLQGLFD